MTVARADCGWAWKAGAERNGGAGVGAVVAGGSGETWGALREWGGRGTTERNCCGVGMAAAGGKAGCAATSENGWVG